MENIVQVMYIHTNGCDIQRKVRKPKFETMFSNAGYKVVSTPDEATTIIFIVCTFTNTAEEIVVRDVNNWISHGKNVVLTGCISATLAKKTNALILIENKEKQELSEYFKLKPTVQQSNHFLIETGCVGNCTYCSIKRAQEFHGKLKSDPPDVIINGISKIVNSAKSTPEIHLLGHDVSAYGLDIGTNLPNLLRRIFNEFGEIDVYLGNLCIQNVNRWSMEDLTLLSRIKGHVMLPLQSANDDILELMGRGSIKVDDFNRLYRILREMHVDIGTDLISGFPGETLYHHEQNLQFIKDHPMSFMEIFRYDERWGTPAYDYPNQIDLDEKNKRTAELIAMCLFVNSQGKDILPSKLVNTNLNK